MNDETDVVDQDAMADEWAAAMEEQADTDVLSDVQKVQANTLDDTEQYPHGDVSWMWYWISR